MPYRDGVAAARVRMPVHESWDGVAEFLTDRTGDGDGVQRRVAAGEVVLEDGTIVTQQTEYRPGGRVYLYRDLPVEVTVPGEAVVLHHDENLVVVDKPHFLATMPKGGHVHQSVVVLIRQRLRLPDLAPAHRLDRLTAGVLMLTTHREVRGAYQSLFAAGVMRKSYLAVAEARDELATPRQVSSRIVKERGVLQAREVSGQPNAHTTVHLIDRDGDVGLYRLTPHTGRTHQLRVHMTSLGIPIFGDSLYPDVRQVAPDDFGSPLQLLAAELSFTDPFTRELHQFRSRRRLAAWPGPVVPNAPDA